MKFKNFKYCSKMQIVQKIYKFETELAFIYLKINEALQTIEHKNLKPESVRKRVRFRKEYIIN